MELKYNLFNIITLFGAIQGFILCIFIYQKKIANKLSVNFFLLFLFSLAFYNLIYALMYMDVFRYYRPLHMFPFPYNWLIGAGFYFYIKNQFQPNDRVVYHKKEWYLLLPAVLYGLLRTYWFSISVNENSYRITEVIVDSDFFRIHQFFYQFFTIFLLISCFRYIKKNEVSLIKNQKSKPFLLWLKRLTLVFLIIMILDVLLYSIDLLLHNFQETIIFSYPTFILNTLFIYWIGYMGFSNSKQFFNTFALSDNNSNSINLNPIKDKLKFAIENEELFLNPNISLQEFAIKIESTPKELSKYINEVNQMNFSEFLNFHRVEKVKQLLSNPETEKFTLVTLAKDAGFSSKSSFNDIFKKSTGITPSEYKKKNSAK